MDSLSVWLCCFELDAIQNMQFRSLALQSPEHQYLDSKLSKLMLVKSHCDSFGRLPSNLHFHRQKTVKVTVDNSMLLTVR